MLNTLSVGQKRKDTFRRSSFLASGATLSTGRLEVEDWILKAVLLPHRGHYQPTEENLEKFLSFFQGQEHVQKCTMDEELTKLGKRLPLYQSETDLANYFEELSAAQSSQAEDDNTEEPPFVREGEGSSSTWSRRMGSKLMRLEIPRRTRGSNLIGDNDRAEIYGPSLPRIRRTSMQQQRNRSSRRRSFMFRKMNLDDNDDDEGELDQRLSILKENILQRIDSHKSMRSYQLAYQPSTKWTTGAGPRIGCLRDYPPELGSWILEQGRPWAIHLHPKRHGIVQ